jgi:RNA polymerase sigma factor (sigma-70 family)
MTDETDMSELVRIARAGDRLAWNRIVERYSSLLWAVTRGYRLTLPQAEDVVQTCWLRLVEHLDRIRDPNHLGAWLATTARRESLRLLRAAARESPSYDPAAGLESVDTESVETLAILSDQSNRLWRAFLNLPEHCFRLLRTLLATPPPSYAEVAATLDMPIGSIGPTRMRCLQQLRKTIEAMGITGEPASP